MSNTLTDCARTFLAAQSDLTALLGSDDVWTTWIFQEKPYALIEGSQTCAIVLTQESQWTSPNTYNTEEFPRLGVQIWADPQRSLNNVVQYDDTAEKIITVMGVLNKYLHSVNGHDAMWANLRVVNSTRLNEPVFSPLVDGDKARTAMVFFACSLGGYV